VKIKFINQLKVKIKPYLPALALRVWRFVYWSCAKNANRCKKVIGEFSFAVLNQKNKEKIFGIGLSRTGTVSLSHALTILSYNSSSANFMVLN